jgi:hypothetical protein
MLVSNQLKARAKRTTTPRAVPSRDTVRAGARIRPVSIAVSVAIYCAAALRLQPAALTTPLDVAAPAAPQMLRGVIRHPLASCREHPERPHHDPAMTGQTLQQLNMQTFLDFVKRVPNVIFSIWVGADSQ